MSSSDGVNAVHDAYDVVVGHGVSGLSTAIAAHEAGAMPVILEKSPRSKRGGHTQYAGVLFRFPMTDLETVVDDLDLDDPVEAYPETAFMDDLQGVSDGRADEALCETLVENAYDAVRWLADHGVGWHVVDHSEEPGFGTTVGTVQADGEGQGVVDALADCPEELGIDAHYRTEFRGVETDADDSVAAATAVGPEGKVRYEASSVVSPGVPKFSAGGEM